MNFIEEVRRRVSEEGREERREVLNSSVRIVDKIYEAGGYGLSGPCTSESGHRLDSGSPFWRIQLDQDLLDTISAIYPEWFKDYTNSRAASTSSPTSTSASGAQSCNDSAAVVVVTGGEHKVAKGDTKSKSKAKKADGHKDKDRDRKDPRRDAKDERDAGNGKKGTKPSPQQDKAAADAAGRKAASAVPGSESKMAEGNQSPPKAEVDDSPLQHAMDRNKEYDMSMKINGRDKNHPDTLCTLNSVCRYSLFLLAIRSPFLAVHLLPPVVETEASLFDPTATENIDKRKEVVIVSIQGWPRSNGREQEHDGKEEKDEEKEDEREGSLEPKNSGDRVLTLTARHRSELILARAMPTHSELNGTSSLPSASDRAWRRLIRLSADTPINVRVRRTRCVSSTREKCAKHVVASASRHHAEMRMNGSVNRPCRWYSASSLWDVQSVLCVSVLPATLSLHEEQCNRDRDEVLSLGRPTLRLVFTDENEWCAFSASLYYEINQHSGIDRRRPL
ncbi:hypothetical protein ALC53_09499 [Atta colombica]|uniref:Uncharacterized protein n=1 Tax=Atta colombica TaxID=520822 RepID=A0A195B632_9HYME|nr:hypothetical protein ALC53_09499 [Atta colombica]